MNKGLFALLLLVALLLPMYAGLRRIRNLPRSPEPPREPGGASLQDEPAPERNRETDRSE